MKEFILEAPPNSTEIQLIRAFQIAIESALTDVEDGDLLIVFAGHPWRAEKFAWPGAYLRGCGKIRPDIMSLVWLRCKLITAECVGRPRESVYNGALVAEFGLPTSARCRVWPAKFGFG